MAPYLLYPFSNVEVKQVMTSMAYISRALTETSARLYVSYDMYMNTSLLEFVLFFTNSYLI
jgi:hypothetical protein